MKFIKLGVAATIAAVSFGITLIPAAHAAEDKVNYTTVDTFFYSLNDLYVNQLSVALQDKALSSGLKLKQHDANDDLMLQISQIETVVNTKNDKTPILVNPVDTQNGTAALLAAKENGLPIIFFNRKVDDNVLASYKDAWYVGTDPNTAAQYQANLVENYITSHSEADRNGDGIISYILLKGEVGHQDTNARSGNFLRTIIENNKIFVKPIETMYANWSQADAQNLMRNYIAKHGLDEVELIVSNNDAMALGALSALQANGYNLPKKGADKSKYIPVVGIDAIPLALDAIENGTLIGTVLNDADAMADVAIRIVDCYLEGKSVDEKNIGHKINNHTILLPYVQITTDNVDSYNK